MFSICHIKDQSISSCCFEFHRKCRPEDRATSICNQLQNITLWFTALNRFFEENQIIYGQTGDICCHLPGLAFERNRKDVLVWNYLKENIFYTKERVCYNRGKNYLMRMRACCTGYSWRLLLVNPKRTPLTSASSAMLGSSGNAHW